MAKPGRRGVARIAAAAGYSWAGLKAAFKHEAAFRQELALVAVALPLAFVFGQNGIEYALLIGSGLLVLIVELLNSAIEAVVDRVDENFHELAGRAKDCGSAAVLVALVNMAVVWATVVFFH